MISNSLQGPGRRAGGLLGASLLALGALTGPGAAQVLSPARPIPVDDVKSRHTPIEVSPLRSLVLSLEGTKLYALNQGGARLQVLDSTTLQLLKSIPVGPGVVSVHLRPEAGELWLVDSITGAVSVMNEASGVIQHSIRVGAQPMGLAFSPSYDRAYVTCSGVNRVDVIATATMTVVKQIPVPVVKPRGIAVVGNRAFVAPFMSGNNTATRGSGRGSRTNDAFEVRSLADFPTLNQLPDRDLLTIVSDPSDPSKDALDLGQTLTGLGTTLFAVRERGTTGELWIPHTEALNGVHKGSKNFVGGQVVRNRVTLVDTTGQRPPQIVDLDALAPDADSTCAQPTSVAFKRDGTRAFVTGYGTDRIAVLDVARGPVTQVTWAGYIEVASISSNPPTAGPRDALVNDAGTALYLHHRIDNAVVRIDLTALPTTPNFAYVAPPATSLGFDPTARQVKRGRSHANNARFSASQTSSCDSCHVDAHTDGVVWDLSDYADPEGTPNPMLGFGLDVKGPLVTQSVHALAETGPYHWRGEQGSLFDFNNAFVGLLERLENGVPTPLVGDQFAYIVFYMQGFAYPANPLQQQSRRHTPTQLQGADLFLNKPVLGNLTCASCHTLPLGTQNELVENEPNALSPTIVVPQLRGIGEKIVPAHLIGGEFGIRNELGSGFNHGGVLPGLRDVALQELPGQPGVQKFNLSPAEADAIAEFLTSLDTGLAPATAYQVTAHGLNALQVEGNQLAFLMDQARLGNCDLIFRRAAITVAGQQIYEAGLFDPVADAFRPAAAAGALIDPHQLILDAISPGKPVTFFGMPLRLGSTMSIDRDDDGLLDHDELTLGTGLDSWDSDGDLYPDGYEVLHGMDPTTLTGSSPDLAPPQLAQRPSIVYSTQTSVKFEFETTEVARVQVSLDGGPPIMRVPFGPLSLYDDRFSLTLGTLEHGRVYEVFLELTDPAGNQAVQSFKVATKFRKFGDPVYVEDILPAITGSGPHALDVQVSLQQLGQPAPAGYTVEGQVFQVLASGSLVMVAPTVSATAGAGGIAQFSVPLPAKPASVGEVFFVVQDIVHPPSLAPYVRALSTEVFDSTSY